VIDAKICLTLGMLVSTLGCNAERDEENPFESGPANTSAPPQTASAGDDGGSTGDVDLDDDGDVLSTGLGGSTGDDGFGSSGGPPDGDSGSDGAMQPGGGMYADCLTNDDCGGFPLMCLTIADENMNTIDGFCSVSPCSDPIADCDPSPGGTATPACMPTSVNGMASNACALACSGGAGCPGTMTCYDFGDGEFCG
jgi:hypothetical protein